LYIKAKRKQVSVKRMIEVLALYYMVKRLRDTFKEAVRVFIWEVRGRFLGVVSRTKWLRQSRKWGSSLEFKVKNRMRDALSFSNMLSCEMVREQALQKLKIFILAQSSKAYIKQKLRQFYFRITWIQKKIRL